MEWTVSDLIEAAQHFTGAYKNNEFAPKAVREATCLQALYPDGLADIGEWELFAGRRREVLVGYAYSLNEGDLGYYINERLIYSLRSNNRLTSHQNAAIRELEEFWSTRGVLQKLDHVYKTPDVPDEIRNMLYLSNAEVSYTEVSFAANAIPRITEINLDFDLLLTLGINGLRDKLSEFINLMKAATPTPGKDTSLYEGMLSALDTFEACCLYYAKQAREMSDGCDEKRRLELLSMAFALENISAKPPSSLREAIQLYWLYSNLACLDNFGRMDIYLGDFYARDIDSGTLSIIDAQVLINTLWRQIEQSYPQSGRVIIGGKGRRNELNADRFAVAAMEASRVTQTTTPSLSLRLYDGQSPSLIEKAYDVIESGCTYPFLYNDEIIIPIFEETYKASSEDAKQYIMSNCGELTLDHMAITTPSASVIYLKLLELVLFDGYCHSSKTPMGRKTGGLTAFKTFEDLWDAFFAEVTFVLDLVTDHATQTIRTAAEESPNLFCSMLFDDCLIKNAGLIDGARYMGINVETHIVLSTAQSLYSIKRFVYEEKLFTPEEMLEMLKKDFAGYEREQNMILSLPQYGNDDFEVDEFIRSVEKKINSITRSFAKKCGMDYVVPSHVSVDAHVSQAKHTIASADGRNDRTPMSNSINPLPGRDKKGLTAVLNSMLVFPANDNNGLVSHIKLDRKSMQNRKAVSALVQSYFRRGGSHLCINVLNRGDLEDALIHPERHTNLMVRVGGYSARFVSLYPELQQEIISRTLYEG